MKAVQLMRRVVCVCVLALVSGLSQAATINVPVDQPTIQDGINAAVSGVDEVVVDPGTYNEAINFLGKAITVRSASGDPADTIINGTGNFHVVQCVNGEGSFTVLQGFTITGGNANGASFPDDRGGGMLNTSSSSTVTNCTFTGNTAGYGGGMFNQNSSSPTVTSCSFSGNTVSDSGGGMYNQNSSSPTLTNCSFSGNTATNNGGGMYNNGSSNPSVWNCTFSGNTATNDGGGMFNASSSPTVTNCLFSGNTATSNGGGMYNNNCSPTVTNCLFSGNTANIGGGMLNLTNSSPTLTNCSFSGNMANIFGGGMYNQNSSPTMTNCILWGDSPDEIYNSSSTPTVSFSDVQGGLSAGMIDGGGNIDADPLFADADGADNIFGTADDHCRLQTGSPCIDAGDTGAVPVDVTIDLAGKPRISHLIVDMGAFEVQDADGDGVPNYLDTPSVHNVTQGTDYFMLQGSIDAAVNGDEIEADPGTYNEVINFNNKAISLSSTSGEPNDTIIDGAGFNTHVVLCVSGETSVTVLSGFTITGGNASDYGGGMFNNNSSPTVTNCIFSGNTASDYGGGMFNASSSPTVTNCSFNGNTATANGGGGMYNSGSSPTVTGCTLSGNTAGWGGGMYNAYSSNPTVTNCLFSGNTASAYGGGGMHNYSSSSPMVTSCTFSGNTSSDVGGGMFNESNSSPTVTNCILWGDSPDEIFNSGVGSIITVRSSDVQGVLPTGVIDGGGNIDVDPLFVDADGVDNTIGTEDDDLRLQAGSFAIDAGNTTAIPAGVFTDLDGYPRAVDDPDTVDTGISLLVVTGDAVTIDMGAYESQVNCSLVGDVNCDGIVNLLDLALLAGNWLATI